MPRIQPIAQYSTPRASPIPLLPISNSDTYDPDDAFDKIEKDDAIWKQYVKAARDFDAMMVKDWNDFLDVILVFVSTSLLWFIS